MSIPNIPAFEALLASITAVDFGDTCDLEQSPVIPESFALDVNGPVEVPERPIRYRSISDLPFDALVTRIQKELHTKKHPATRSIVLAVLAVFSLRRRPGEPAVKELNRILDYISEAQVSQTFLFPPVRTPEFSLRLGHFQFQVIDLMRLRYRCERAQSDFFERYADRLVGRLSIERDMFPARIINWFQDMKDDLQRLIQFQSLREAYGSFMDFYFEEISRVFIANFWSFLLGPIPLLNKSAFPA